MTENLLHLEMKCCSMLWKCPEEDKRKKVYKLISPENAVGELEE